jgi:succinate dehydrogenase/fumarate reductase flavoprotein subunit/2,4-dienoyl-CoA reductase-like NADH-dependent reductase (Old Yellow Enzyme family)
MNRFEKFRFGSGEELREKALQLGVDLPWSDSLEALLQPFTLEGYQIPNRLAVQPMEGFDSDENGNPGELAFRRYGRYAAGGSGMIWFEACSVVPEGRSNPHQMMITPQTVPQLRKLTDHIRQIAESTFGAGHRPFLVLQLTHSGRYSNPGRGFVPKYFSNNPVLELKKPVEGDPQPYYTDNELDNIRDAFIEAMHLAELAGFDSVDVKACHGYLLHEMLYAYDRTDSRYGGSFEGRTRFLAEVLNEPSRLVKSIRLSGFDLIPHPHGFGMAADGSDRIELTEVKKLIGRFSPMVPLYNITAGIPRLAAHVGRPFDRGVFNAPPPDEHPLEGIARLVRITGELQKDFPEQAFVGTGYSWLRQYYPNVGAGVVNQGLARFIGLGRSSFAYPDAPLDLLRSGRLNPKKTCVSCSKCTELMRTGGPTGCAVRDDKYKGGRRKEEVVITNPGLQSGDTNNPGFQSGASHPWSGNVLIVGSGAAALAAAVALWEAGEREILIVTEKWGGGTSNNAGSDKQTYYKQSLDPNVADSAGEMAADLCRGGAMHGDIALVEAQYSLPAFFNLVRLGVPFPHDEYGAYPGYKTDHDPRARATSAGPLTSHLMFESLARKVKEYGIPVADGIMIFDLLTDETNGETQITGAAGMRLDAVSDPDHGLRIFQAPHVILATGGPAGIYKHSVYPEDQKGGIGMALRIGAKAQNLSISQFGIASTKFRWNLSGSYQQVVPKYFSTEPDGSGESEFLNSHFPDEGTLFTAIFLKGYQWPFDPAKTSNYGSSLIDLLVQEESRKGRRIWIDFRTNPSEFSMDKLKTEAREYLEKSGAIAATPFERLQILNQPAINLYLSHDIDLASEPLEIAVCAQHNNGGLTGDTWYETNIRGLFAIGEVNGSHGLTRPGGSALNAGQVGALRAAARIMSPEPMPVIPAEAGIPAFAGMTERRPASRVPILHVPRPASRSSRVPRHEYLNLLLNSKGTLNHHSALTALQSRMSEFAGIIREKDHIREALEEAWKLWDRMNNDLEAVPAEELPAALRTFDLCLTHVVYLESVLEFLENSGDQQYIKEHILEVKLTEDHKVEKTWVPVRPIPKKELWFENIWKQYRET